MGVMLNVVSYEDCDGAGRSRPCAYGFCGNRKLSVYDKTTGHSSQMFQYGGGWSTKSSLYFNSNVCCPDDGWYYKNCFIGDDPTYCTAEDEVGLVPYVEVG